MASKSVHIAQAVHNEKLSLKLIGGDFYDWSCTTSFYSALHYVEAKFNDIPEIQHTNSAYGKWAQAKKTSPLTTNEPDQSVHGFRLTLLGHKFPKIREAYRSLEVASEQVRYLEGGDRIACDLISPSDAKSLLEDDLEKIKKELGFDKQT